MKHFTIQCCLPLLLLGLCLSAYSQVRYLEEVFSEVQVSDSVLYSINHSVHPLGFITVPDTLPRPQYLDVYEPIGDTESQRPLILFAITGTFFPRIMNNEFVGDLKDFMNVEYATRMAKRGYVVAIVEYRCGWNFFTDSMSQRKTYVEAFYRGVQDLRAAVRYFRKTAAEDGNPWGIDPNRIVVGGTGTGGTVAYGAAYLDRYDQITLDKFTDFSHSPPTPFVDTTQLGNPFGTSIASKNIPNHPGYSSEFRLGFALQGALLDGSWVEADDIPFLAMHSYRDPSIPFGVGDIMGIDRSLSPPTTFTLVPDVAGGRAVLDSANRLGIQDALGGMQWGGSISAYADSINEDLTGFYPFITPFTPGAANCLPPASPGIAADTLQEWSICWNWFDETIGTLHWDAFFAAQINTNPPSQIDGATAVCQAKRGFPNDLAKAKLYMDTIVGFTAPQIYHRVVGTLDGISELSEEHLIRISPNPSPHHIQIEYIGVPERSIKQVWVMDISGKIIIDFGVINSRMFVLEKQQLPLGLYLIRIQIGEQYIFRKIVFE